MSPGSLGRPFYAAMVYFHCKCLFFSDTLLESLSQFINFKKMRCWITCRFFFQLTCESEQNFTSFWFDFIWKPNEICRCSLPSIFKEWKQNHILIMMSIVLVIHFHALILKREIFLNNYQMPRVKLRSEAT